MERERIGRAVGPTRPLCPHHVGEADAPLLREVRREQVDLGPLLVGETSDRHRTAERVGVGHRQRRLGPVHLDVAVARRLRVEAGDEGGDGPRRELDGGRDVGRHLDVDQLAPLRFRQDRALLPADPRGTGHTACRAEQLHEGREVVRAHVEERAGTVLVEEPRIRVPPLGAGLEHERVRGEGLPDVTSIDHRAGGLQTSTEEGVGRATEAAVVVRGELDETRPFGEVDAERLLAEDGLSHGERGTRDVGVELRWGEVDDCVDVRVVHDVVECAGARTVLVRELLRALGDPVDARGELEESQLGEGAGVHGTDDAASHDGDAAHDRPCESPVPTRLL